MWLFCRPVPQPRYHPAVHTELIRSCLAALWGLGRIITVTGLSRNNDVRCNLLQALRLCTCHTDQSGCRDISLLFLDHGTRRGSGQRHAPAAIYPWKDTVPIVQEARWASGPVWMGAEYLARIAIRSPKLSLLSVKFVKYVPCGFPTVKFCNSRSKLWNALCVSNGPPDSNT